MVVVDKHKSIAKKNQILARELAKVPHEHLYIIPAVRELLEKYSRKPDTSEGGAVDANGPHEP